MTTSKIFVGFVILLFSVGCATFGGKKPTVFVDKHNNVPADIPSQFCDRYERFVTGKECKEFKKLQTDEERQIFIDKFWLERDPDPATSENEEKQRIDQLIDDIADEYFLNTPGGVFGLSFRANGGFRGDMAHVYLLHGKPDAMDAIEGQFFVDLMLWIYTEQQSGEILYAFLFYQPGNIGTYSLFPQDIYKLDPCGAINQIKKFKDVNLSVIGQVCPPDVEKVFRDLQGASGKNGVLDGQIFTWALFNFSESNPSTTQGRALGVPQPASELAKQSKARVMGEAPERVGTAGTDYVLASCEKCNSFIPAKLFMDKEIFTISARWKNFDWVVNGDYLQLSLKYKVTFQDQNVDKPIVLEGLLMTQVKRSSLDENPEGIFIVDLLDSKQVATIPAGTYRVSVYVKNLMTGKYNSWIEELVK